MPLMQQRMESRGVFPSIYTGTGSIPTTVPLYTYSGWLRAQQRSVYMCILATPSVACATKLTTCPSPPLLPWLIMATAMLAIVGDLLLSLPQREQ